MPLQEAPFGDYADVTGAVDATAKAEIEAIFDSFGTFIPSLPEDQPAPMTDFDKLVVSSGVALQKELAALRLAIAAAP